MIDFKASGLWYLGNAPQNRVAGTLTFSKRGLHLRLLGAFREGWNPAENRTYPLIHGVVSECPYGNFVTLIDCFTKQTRLSSGGIGSEIIHCNRGIAGDAHLTEDYNRFETLDVGISYLSDWYGRKGISWEIASGARSDLDVHYRMPETTRRPLDRSVLTLGMARKWSHSLHRFVIAEAARVSIEPLPGLTTEELHHDYIRPLQNLLSFATDTPNAVDGIELHGEKVARDGFERNRKYRLLYNPIFRLKRKKDRLLKDDMLFDFDEAEQAGLNIFESWFNFTRKHEAFCTAYFASLYAPPRYLDEKFLRLMSAFKLLVGSLGEISRRTTDFLDKIHELVAGCFTEAEQALIAPVIPIGSEIEAPARLLELLIEHEPIMKQIIAEDLAEFARSISDTSSYIERRFAAEGSAHIQKEKLFYAMVKLRFLIKIVVLKELGFGEGRIADMMQRNEHFARMKTL